MVLHDHVLLHLHLLILVCVRAISSSRCQKHSLPIGRTIPLMKTIDSLSESIFVGEFTKAASSLHHDHVSYGVQLVGARVFGAMSMASSWVNGSRI